MRKEMDGCLPLEAWNVNQEQWFFKNPRTMLALNSGRSAILTAVKDYEAKGNEVKRVFIPLYLCDTVKTFLESHNIQTEEYNLTDAFIPDFLSKYSLKRDELLLWPNYFGCMIETTIEQLSDLLSNQLIIDNTQAFFSKPRYKSYNVYSCRKFIGVADGAYLIHGELFLNQESIPACIPHMDMWLSPLYSFLTGANSAYKYYLNNGEFWREDYCAMTPLTEFVLHSVDYNKIQLRRRKNFRILHQRLGKYNLLRNVSFDSDTAYYYPFLAKRKMLREYLVKNNVYASTWWKRVVFNNKANLMEKELAEYLVPVVIDQRYNKDDMQDLSKLIVDFLESESL